MTKFSMDKKGITEYPRSEFGDFKHRVIFDAVNLGFDHYHPQATFMNMGQRSVFGYGSLYDADGGLYVFVRELPAGATIGLGLFSDQDGKNCRAPKGGISSYRGSVDIRKTDKDITWLSGDYAYRKEPSLMISHDGGRLHWQEKNIMDLKGRAMQPGIQWYDPSPESQGYAMLFHRVSGTVMGKAVEGWIGLDVIYLGLGQIYSESPMAKWLKLSWCAFANEYEDGAWELGSITKGFENFSMAIIVNNLGDVIRGSYIDAEYEKDEQGYPTRMRFRFKEEVSHEPQEWVWTPHPRGRLIDLPAASANLADYRGCEGVLSRAGETRKIKVSFGWPDFYGDERVELYRGLKKASK
jgi:hypothetical protein